MNVFKDRGDFEVLRQTKGADRISFSVNSGEIVGILGPNGAGKSTMMKIITGFLHPDEGKVWVNDLSNEGEHPSNQAADRLSS